MDDKPDALTIDTVFPGISPSLKSLLMTRLDRLYDHLEKSGQKQVLSLVNQEELFRIFLFSDFVADNLAKQPDLLQDLAESGDLEQLRNPGWYQNQAIQKTAEAGADQAKAVLKAFKCRETVRIAWRDLTGKAGLTETLSDLSELAVACVSQALDVLHEKVCATHGTPMDPYGHPQKMVILGMGKLGAKELNFSSDIDLIFVYPKEGNTYLDGQTKTSNLDFSPGCASSFSNFCIGLRTAFLSGGHPAAALRGQRASGDECGCVCGVFPDPGPGMGAVCHDQGRARGRGSGCRTSIASPSQRIHFPPVF